MLLLRFTDGSGAEWEVWEVGVRPAAEVGAPPASGTAERPERWLCFAAAGERRRMRAYSAHWHALPPDQLEGLCRRATPARPTPPYTPALAHDERATTM